MKNHTPFLMLDKVPTLPSLYYTWQSSWKAQVLHLQVLAGMPSILKPCPQRNPNHHNNPRQSTFSLLLSPYSSSNAPKMNNCPLSKLLGHISHSQAAYLNQFLGWSPFILFSTTMESTRHTAEGEGGIINDIQNETLNGMMDSSENLQKLLYNLIIISKTGLKGNNVRELA